MYEPTLARIGILTCLAEWEPHKSQQRDVERALISDLEPQHQRSTITSEAVSGSFKTGATLVSLAHIDVTVDSEHRFLIDPQGLVSLRGSG